MVTALVLCVMGGVRLQADVIDRILATVGGALILQSDAVAAVRFGFVQLPAAGRSRCNSRSIG